MIGSYIYIAGVGMRGGVGGGVASSAFSLSAVNEGDGSHFYGCLLVVSLTDCAPSSHA